MGMDRWSLSGDEEAHTMLLSGVGKLGGGDVWNVGQKLGKLITCRSRQWSPDEVLLQ